MASVLSRSKKSSSFTYELTATFLLTLTTIKNMYKKLSNLNVGDIFQYGDTIYEIVEKGAWHAKCKYINETPKSEYSPNYLFMNFSLYKRVKV